MNTQNLLDLNEASCVINAHGRMLAANSRFCRMFGFEQGEPEWHYMSDLYRHAEEWKIFFDSVSDAQEQRHFVARLRNRKGRSFKCRITRVAHVSEEGKLTFVNQIAKIESPRDAVLPADTVRPLVRQVFLTTCAHCQRAQDANGQWVEVAQKNHGVRISQRPHYCPQCAQLLFPDVLMGKHSADFEEEAVAMVR